MAKPITINIDNKPHLLGLLSDNPKRAQELVGALVECIEEGIQNGWHELPELFGNKLTMRDIVKGVLHGALDLQDLNPEAYEVLKEEVHPLAMLVPRKNPLDGMTRYFDWRETYKLDSNAQIDQTTVETIIRKLLRYYRYVDVEALAHALIYKQVKTFEGLGERSVKTLPFYPALRYQQRLYGDLHVGKFFDDTGFLDCGIWTGESETCPSCQREGIVHAGAYHYCKSCNAGFKDGTV